MRAKITILDDNGRELGEYMTEPTDIRTSLLRLPEYDFEFGYVPPRIDPMQVYLDKQKIHRTNLDELLRFLKENPEEFAKKL